MPRIIVLDNLSQDGLRFFASRLFKFPDCELEKEKQWKITEKR